MITFLVREVIPGSEETQLTHNSTLDGDPTWSPDGRQIFFVTERALESFGQVYVMNADGFGQTPVDQYETSTLAWSPGGVQVAWAGGTTFESPDRGIYVMNTDGSGRTQLIDAARVTQSLYRAGVRVIPNTPTWSPDGQLIAFSAGPFSDFSSDIYLINADGSGLINLTHNPILGKVGDYTPVWSPAFPAN